MDIIRSSASDSWSIKKEKESAMCIFERHFKIGETEKIIYKKTAVKLLKEEDERPKNIWKKLVMTTFRLLKVSLMVL